MADIKWEDKPTGYRITIERESDYFKQEEGSKWVYYDHHYKEVYQQSVSINGFDLQAVIKAVNGFTGKED